jgi:hypothetical protein
MTMPSSPATALRVAAACAAALGAALLLLGTAPPAQAATAPGAATPAPAKPRAVGPAKSGSKTQRKTKRVRAPVPVKAVAGATRPHRVSDSTAKITAFPQKGEGPAVDRAFAEHRREQIADAEKAARAAKQDDRWRTVLFYIRDLDSRTDPEACFWRVVAYYRLGEIGRARSIRRGCEIPARDAATLDDEDASAARLQPPTALPELKLAGELDEEGRPTGAGQEPVANSEPYTGQPPTRYK